MNYEEDEDLQQEYESDEDYMIRTGLDTQGHRLSNKDYEYLLYGDLD